MDIGVTVPTASMACSVVTVSPWRSDRSRRISVITADNAGSSTWRPTRQLARPTTYEVAVAS